MLMVSSEMGSRPLAVIFKARRAGLILGGYGGDGSVDDGAWEGVRDDMFF